MSTIVAFNLLPFFHSRFLIDCHQSSLDHWVKSFLIAMQQTWFVRSSHTISPIHCRHLCFLLHILNGQLLVADWRDGKIETCFTYIFSNHRLFFYDSLIISILFYSSEFWSTNQHNYFFRSFCKLLLTLCQIETNFKRLSSYRNNVRDFKSGHNHIAHQYSHSPTETWKNLIFFIYRIGSKGFQTNFTLNSIWR